MKINLCNFVGHKWIPVYIIGYFGNVKTKFIGAECKRCGYGHNDLLETVSKMDRCPVNTYTEKYYKAP